MKATSLKQIPSVSVLLNDMDFAMLIDMYSQKKVVEGIRHVLDEKRKALLAGAESVNVNKGCLAHEVDAYLNAEKKPHLCRMINATGIVVHTNMGRAPLSNRAIQEIMTVAGNYSNLEFDLEKGKRGSRYSHVEHLLCQLTGAESALVVNNNAAAVMLCLSSLAKDKEVVISRGELVEIGGSFRIPEVMETSGAHLHEVGATNKTHLRDYEKVINEETALVLKVHSSNYRILGFTSFPTAEELIELAHQKGLPIMEDMGSGILLDNDEFKFSDEPTVAGNLALGMDIVTFSGDKLLGGPQAGIIVGKKEFIEEMKHNPLLRAIRIDKLSLAALEGTLLSYLNEDKVSEDIPVWRMLKKPLGEIDMEAELLGKALSLTLQDKAEVSVIEGFSEAGGGSLPTMQFPTFLVAIKPKNDSETSWAEKLRLRELPVLVRCQQGQILVDPRTLLAGEGELLEQAFREIAG